MTFHRLGNLGKFSLEVHNIFLHSMPVSCICFEFYWLLAMLSPVVIGQNNYFGFSFNTVENHPIPSVKACQPKQCYEKQSSFICLIETNSLMHGGTKAIMVMAVKSNSYEVQQH